jgi:hypothetical protein
MTWMQSKILLVYVSFCFHLIMQSQSLLAQSNGTSKEGKTPASEQASSKKTKSADKLEDRADDETSNDDNDLEDENYATSDLAIDEDSLANAPLSLDLKYGRTWIDQEVFNAEFIQFTPAWYISEDLPLKLGPTIRKEHFIDLENGYTTGGLMEIGIQGSFFWDYGFIAPYVAAEYTFLSRGNLTLNRSVDGISEKGTIKLNSSGYELALGAQVNIYKDSYLILEAVVIGEKRIKKDGNIARNASEVVDASEPSKARSYRGASIGYLLEL